eukprot:IDg20289t1
MPGLTFHCDLCKSCVPYTHDHYNTMHGVLHATPQAGGPPPHSHAGPMQNGLPMPVPSVPAVHSATFDPSTESVVSVDTHHTRRTYTLPSL